MALLEVSAALLLLLLRAAPEEHHAMHEEPPASTEEHHAHADPMEGPLGLSLQGTGSGTAWQPPSTPMFGHHFGLGDWSLMLHYDGFGGFDAQSTRRGDKEWGAVGWVMGMLHGPLGGGSFGVRAMLSPEPLVWGQDGYPLLLQTGETAFGRPLVDRQHPHDLFMELALTWDVELSDDVALELYAAPSGEPALGPVAFPHRVSAMANPLAPLGHHWQDSTHISFGVLTAGVYTRTLKLEASWFNGVEPDEDRYDLDLRVPDSGSVRATVIPNENWALSASLGYLRAPERTAPDESLVRAVATAAYNDPLGEDANWATTFVLGQNVPLDGASTSTSFLVESTLQANRNVFFGRAEVVEKTAHDFQLPELPEDPTVPVTALTFGFARQFGPFSGVVPALGILGTVNALGPRLEELYDSRLPVGAMVYLWVSPAEMRHAPMHGH